MTGYPALGLEEAARRLAGPGSPFEIETQSIRGEAQRVWKHAPPTLRDVLLGARRHGERPFLVYNEERVSFESFARACLKLADELARLGVGKGDRVAIAMRNLPEWPVAFFAPLLLGAIAVPLNAWGVGAELEFGLRDCGARVAFADRERWERLFEHLPRLPALERVFVARASEDIAHPVAAKLEDVLGEVADWSALPDLPAPQTPLAPEDDATIIYTSGTTGKPKGALGTHRNSTTTILARLYGVALAALRRGETPATPDPRAPPRAVLLSAPLFHTMGCQSTLVPALHFGFKLVMMRKWDVDQARRLIERERITSVGGVPTTVLQLVEHRGLADHDLSSLEMFAFGAAPPPADLVRRIRGAFPRVQAYTAGGLTETSAAFTVVAGEDYALRPASCGRALPVGDIRIVGADGRDVAPGEAGEIWVRGSNVVRGYWGQPQATQETFGGGWLRTGDIARLDADGFCYIVDRAKDMLIRGGENIYCVEVENALFEHPDVIDAAVVGIPHRTLGEEPGAVVTLKPGAHANESELRAFVAERLAAFKAPVRIVFQAEMLPRNAAGKVLKSELRSRFASPEPSPAS